MRSNSPIMYKGGITMQRIVNTIAGIGMVIIGIGVGSLLFTSPTGTNVTPAPLTAEPVHYESTYAYVPLTEQIQNAGAVFLGSVTSISPAQWNQDSGEFWQEEGLTTLPYHQVEVTVKRSLFDKLGLGNQVTITVIGGSSAGTSPTAKVAIAPEPDHTLKVGDEMVFFVGKSVLAWRGGTPDNQATRPVILFSAYPRYAYLKKQANGLYRSENPEEQAISLDDLIARLTKRRS